MGYAQEERLRRINKLKLTFIRADTKAQSIEEERLISNLILETGCTRKKAVEYIQELLSSGFIERDLGVLWLKDKSYIIQEQLNEIKNSTIQDDKNKL